MYLKPKNTKYKQLFKKRSFLINSNKLLFFYGSVAILLKSNFYINSKQITKLKLFLKKLNKKQEKTKRYVLFKTFPFYPLTKKPQGLRMGKGSGKLNGWTSKTKSGSTFIEFKGIRFGRIRLYFNQFQYKTCLKLSLIKF